MRRTVLFVLALMPSAAPAQVPQQCTAIERHQLDFWVGSWTVHDSDHNDLRIASSRIEAVVNGCAIQERYSSPGAPGGAYEGTSYSSYAASDARWHQMYVDNRGNVTWYTGSVEGPDMILTAPARAGAVQRMVYHREADGSVRQIGTVSRDGGQTWQPSYNYLYRRAPS